MDMGNTIHRTLIIRFSSIGDILLSSLLLRVFHKRFPECQIDYLVKQEYADLVRFNPHVASVMAFPTPGGICELHETWKSIQNSHYDLVVDLHDSIRSRYLCAGVPNVVRIRKRKLARFLLVKVKWDVYHWFGGAPSVAERYLEPVKDLGVENDGNGLEVFIPDSASANADKVLLHAGIKEKGAAIGICPSARHNNKMWLKERFAETASSLAREENAAILLFGSGKDEEIRCGEIKSLIEQQSPRTIVLDLSGRISLLGTAALMDTCSVVITNDSGLMHLAAARKRKVVAIFGPTVRNLGFFPYGTKSTVVEDISLSCRPCTHIGLAHCPRGHFKCMNDIESSTVIEATRLLLREPLEQ